MTLYFTNPLARDHLVSVAAVNEGQPLTYGQPYEVSNRLGAQLLQNAEDWSESAPGRRGTPKASEEITTHAE